MKRPIFITAITGGLALSFIGFTPQIAAAATTCGMPAGFHVNDDETDRTPTPSVDGLVFEGSDLIHHATDVALADLAPGSYTASPAPDQPSFFSVEVAGDDGKYGTLRWNTTAGYWEATSQGQQNHNPDAVALADSFPNHLSHHVVSFGVGYTANPPGTVKTAVSLITFDGQKYDTTCPKPSPTPTATSASPTPKPSPTGTADPTPTATASSSPTAAPAPGGGGLPTTGPNGAVMVGVAALFVLLGIGAILYGRRKTRFTA